MAHPALPSLAEWGNFYVITGSAGAALTGLQFVVIALRSEADAKAPEEAVRAFGTPTILHFCAALLVAAVMSIPGENAASLALCMAAAGIGGLALSVRVVALTRRQSAYTPVLEDWVWHVALPLVAYAALVLAAVVLLRRPAAALDLIAGASLLLLFIGIHNAWDSAVWIAAKRR